MKGGYRVFVKMSIKHFLMIRQREATSLEMSNNNVENGLSQVSER